MIKYPRYIYTLLLVIVTLCITACKDEEYFSQQYFHNFFDFIEENILLINHEQKENEYIFTFENGETVSLPANTIKEIRIDHTWWVGYITFTDNSEIKVAALGNEIPENLIRKLTVNPTGYCPLAAELQLSFPAQSRIKVIVKGKHGPQGDIEYLFNGYNYNHNIEILGLYPNYNNKVDIILTSKYGVERIRTSIQIQTEELRGIVLPDIAVITAKPSQMTSGLTLVEYLGANEMDTHRPFMIDADGEIRWLYLLNTHPTIGNVTAHCGLQRMKSGNFLFGDVKTGRLIEADMLGNVHNTWDIKKYGYEFHHEVTELPNGNLLATVSNYSMKHVSGATAIEDILIEVDKETGEIVTEWDLKKCLEETRMTQHSGDDTGDWAHANAVCYSEEDDCIIVSMRYQGVVKLTRKNSLKWLLAPHKGWKQCYGSLLTPIDENGIRITEPEVISGEKSADKFDWPWGQHHPTLMSNGNIMVFDNGLDRNFEESIIGNPINYSRAVEYKINTSDMTVQQIWQYGKERGDETFAIAGSSVQYIEEDDHILFAPGVYTLNVNGRGGKVIEVDRKTKEVLYEVHISAPPAFLFHRAQRLELYPQNK